MAKAPEIERNISVAAPLQRPRWQRAMTNKNRDEFIKGTKEKLARQSGWLCSDPSCRRPTVGSNSDGKGEIMLGTAAHICAAAPDGPRFDPKQTPEQRKSADNGIWLCRNHSAAVDTSDAKYTVQLLHEWKAQAQKESLRRVLYNETQSVAAQPPSQDAISARLRAAAGKDLDVFRRSRKWPSKAIALTLEVEGLSDQVSSSALAMALTKLDDLILVAPPGMGKTTTLFQIAEAVLANNVGTPIVVSLGDWSTEDVPLLESVLKRPSYGEISESDLRAVATTTGVVLFLDGWNELDGDARKRLTVQVERLQAELPELNLLISTRKQALDVPVNGMHVHLLPLSETQQVELAKAMRGDPGMRMVDQAWRTAGVRELVTIPLYLVALLALPEGAPFPTTKEDVLRRFVAVHEENPLRAEALTEVTHGLHQRFLEDLAVTAIRELSTTIKEATARKSIAETDVALLADGQLTDKLQPKAVLDSLVNHHALTRVGDPPGYSFQHQQFQEWYGSHFVERLMLASIDDSESRSMLKADVLNQPTWEESILFACERLARGAAREQEACAAATLAAFEVDPMLAAEMIYRANDQVWAHIGASILEKITRWHRPGFVDRAVRFMITSGRPEFLDQVWPLITHVNDQVSLTALRAGRRFRTSIFGNDGERRVAALPAKIRATLLAEIAHHSGMDGLNFAAAIAKDDPDPEVKAEVVDALAFRRADYHVAEVLRSADEKTFDLVARQGLVEEIADEEIKKRIEAAGARLPKERSALARLRQIIYTQGNEDLSGELAAIVAEMEIDKEGRADVHLLYEGRNCYLRAIADGLVQRVRAGRTLFYGADDLLASAGFRLEDDELLRLALSDAQRDQRAEAAASVLGPERVGRMIVAVLEASKHVRDPNGKYDTAAGDRYHELVARVAHTPGASLIGAVQARSGTAGNEEMAELADLIARHPDGDRGRPFDEEAFAAICALAEEWGNRMLASGDASRHQLASIAGLATRSRSVRLLPLLKRLLDENLRQYRKVREEASAAGRLSAKLNGEAMTPYTSEYQRAFHAINAPETAALMREYLHDEHFGEDAALVLAAQWTAAEERSDGRPFCGGINLSRVEEMRLARARDPVATSSEGEAIFDATEQLIVDGASEQQRKHAVILGIIAARLPHGQRDATIQKLISMAPRRSRAALLQALILSGEAIDAEIVKDGIAEMYKAAETQTWILHDGWELKDWLRLLPFTNHPDEALAVVHGLPKDHRRFDYLEGLITAFAKAPGDDPENVLFQLAEADPKLYESYRWREAALGRGTVSAARRFIDLAASGSFEKDGVSDRWHVAREIGGLIAGFPEVRDRVYVLLDNGTTTPGLALLAQAVAESPDVDGLLLLIRMEDNRKGSYLSWRIVESVITNHVPSEDWKGAYNIVPVPAVALRKKLLAMTTDGESGDAAARCLRLIDELRDQHGTPDSEPRHPDLESGKTWPILIPAAGE